MSNQEQSLRLGKKYQPQDTSDIDVARMIADQSVRGALQGAVVAALVLTAVWTTGGLLLDQFFPWFSVVQGFFVGRAVQHYGQGLDWRFPLVAAVIAIVAAFVGSFVSALFLTGKEFATPALSLIGEISWFTVRTFATKQFATVGTIYAGMAAVLAGFFANRRLNRREAVALRKHREARAIE